MEGSCDDDIRVHDFSVKGRVFSVLVIGDDVSMAL